MTNPKGTIFATAVMKWLRGAGVEAEKLTQSGSKDEGDMKVVVAGKTYVFELKATKKLNLPDAWREAEIEAKNYAAARNLTYNPPTFAVIKRERAGIEKAWVVCSLESWLEERKTPKP
jgi:hypothetical protein